MRFVCISDTHGQHRKLSLPPGDVLLHAGDISKRGGQEEIMDFNDWLGELDFAHKVMIAGNHDFLFENKPELARSLINNAIYLEDTGIEIQGIYLWGSPISPWFHDWAFNRQRGEDIKRYWDLIPQNTNILITHGPPYNILDMTLKGDHVGCEDLSKAIEQLKPQVHLFGHIHEAYGDFKTAHTHYINASVLNLSYELVNLPFVFDMD